MIKEYINIAHVFLIAVLICLLIFFLSLLLLNNNAFQANQKTSAYECGFNPFQDARIKFDVQFYLVCILFLLFDLEISFLLPIIVIIIDMNIVMVLTLNIFIIILTLGFIYEWLKGSLEWNFN